MQLPALGRRRYSPKYIILVGILPFASEIYPQLFRVASCKLGGLFLRSFDPRLYYMVSISTSLRMAFSGLFHDEMPPVSPAQDDASFLNGDTVNGGYPTGRTEGSKVLQNREREGHAVHASPRAPEVDAANKSYSKSVGG